MIPKNIDKFLDNFFLVVKFYQSQNMNTNLVKKNSKRKT